MDLPNIPPTVHGIIDLPSVTFPPPEAVSDLEARLTFVDDLSLAECVRLDTQLCPSTDHAGPRVYTDRNGLLLPPDQSVLQQRLDEMTTSVHLHDMRLNLLKSKVIPFNFTRKYDFIPSFSIDGSNLDVLY